MAGGYFRSGKAAWFLTAGVIALTLLQIGVQIRFNLWHRDFFNALENRDQPAFMWQMLLFLGFAAASMTISVYQLYVKQLIQLRWRQWLTERLMERWMSSARHYQMERTGESENPDQRIAEDARVSVELLVEFFTGILNSVVMLTAFLGILWSISGPLYLGFMGIDASLPGYMVWAALVYALIGSSITYFVGRPLVGLNFNRTAKEADFRFGLVRARESGEGIALIGGETDERRGLKSLLDKVAVSVKNLMQGQRRLMWLTSAYWMLTGVFPTVVAAPAYFSGAITLGGLMQTSAAFGQVQSSLNWFVDNFPKIAEWRSSVERLLQFEYSLHAIEKMVKDPNQPTLLRTEGVEPNGQEKLAFYNVQVAFADGTVVIQEASAEISPGERVLIKGESGSGKSTLFRAMAGIWPWGKGEIRMPPQDRVLFMPQRPYLPLGSLRAALAYPKSIEIATDEAVFPILEWVGLQQLQTRLNDVERWDQVLSLGEQQRLAFARLLLVKPSWIFLDEATAALDEKNQDAMMQLLTEKLPESAIISIGHRPGLERFHQRLLHLHREKDGAKMALRPPASHIKLKPSRLPLPKLKAFGRRKKGFSP